MAICHHLQTNFIITYRMTWFHTMVVFTRKQSKLFFIQLIYPCIRRIIVKSHPIFGVPKKGKTNDSSISRTLSFGFRNVGFTKSVKWIIHLWQKGSTCTWINTVAIWINTLSYMPLGVVLLCSAALVKPVNKLHDIQVCIIITGGAKRSCHGRSVLP